MRGPMRINCVYFDTPWLCPEVSSLNILKDAIIIGCGNYPDFHSYDTISVSNSLKEKRWSFVLARVERSSKTRWVFGSEGPGGAVACKRSYGYGLFLF